MVRSRRAALVLGPVLTGALAVALAGSSAAANEPRDASAPAPQTAADAPEQWRSYWVDAFNEGIFNPAQVDKLVDNALAVNANVLVVQVARRYDCFCNRALYPRTDAAVAPAPYDPLDEIIEQGHAAGLEVHAWVNVGTLWNSATAPRSPEHAFNTHGPTASGADRWLNKRVDGTELVGANSFMDPANPAAVDYVVDGVKSIVEEYDVDGINLDFIRYPDFSSTTTHSDWGYSETSLARFQAATGRTDVPAPSDPQFSDWRRNQVTGLVRKIYLGMYDIDRTVRLTNDAITYGFGPQSVGGWEKTRTYAEVLQDWKGWLEEGILDTAVAMNYKREWLSDQAQMFEEWNEVIADWQGDRQAVSGTALFLNEVGDTVQQVHDLLRPTAAGNTVAGWSGFSYVNSTLTGTAGSAAVKDAERARLTAALTTGAGAPFAEPAAVPDMPWKDDPTTGNVSGSLRFSDGSALDGTRVTLQPVIGSGQEQSHLSDGSGWFGFVDVEPGTYLLRVDLPGRTVGPPVSVVRVRPGVTTSARTGTFVQVPGS